MSTGSGLRGLALMAAACALAFAACGGDDEEAPASGGSSGSAASGLPDSERISKIQDAGKLRVGVAVALPWLGKDPETNEYFGPATLIAETAAEKLGVELEYVPETFDTIIAAIQADKIDIANAALYATEERKKVVDMVDWSEGGYCYLAKKDSPLTSTDQLNDPNVKMANFVGTGTYETMQEAYPKATQVTRTAAAGEAVNAPEVQSGQADVTPFDAALAEVYKQRFPDLKVFPEDCFENPDLMTPIAAGLPKGDAGFTQFFTELVAELQPQLDEQFKKFAQPEHLEQSG